MRGLQGKRTVGDGWRWAVEVSSGPQSNDRIPPLPIYISTASTSDEFWSSGALGNGMENSRPNGRTGDTPAKGI